MTLPTNILQSLISRNRATITGQHELVVFWKSMMTECPELRTINVEHDVCEKQIVKLSKDIAKLAAVQKALKRELAKLIRQERAVRAMRKHGEEYRLRVGTSRIDEAVKGAVLNGATEIF